MGNQPIGSGTTYRQSEICNTKQGARAGSKRVLLNMKQESCMKIVQNNDDNNWLFGKLLKFEEITRKKES